jgi:hypothetical protein
MCKIELIKKYKVTAGLYWLLVMTSQLGGNQISGLQDMAVDIGKFRLNSSTGK